MAYQRVGFFMHYCPAGYKIDALIKVNVEPDDVYDNAIIDCSVGTPGIGSEHIAGLQGCQVMS